MSSMGDGLAGKLNVASAFGGIDEKVEESAIMPNVHLIQLVIGSDVSLDPADVRCSLTQSCLRSEQSRVGDIEHGNVVEALIEEALS